MPARPADTRAFLDSFWIATLQLGEKTAVFKLMHQRNVDEICRVDVGEPGILHRQQPLHVFKSFKGRERLGVELFDRVGISFLRDFVVGQLEAVT